MSRCMLPQVHFTIKPGDKRVLKARAKKCKLTISSYIRALVNADVQRAKELNTFKQEVIAS